MDFPDPEDEYELMNAEELRIMREIEEDDDVLPFKPKPTHQLSEKRLNFSNPIEENAGLQPFARTTVESSQDNGFLVYQSLQQSKLTSGPSTLSYCSSPSGQPETISSTSTNIIKEHGNKRTVDSIFGDISDIEQELAMHSKRQRLENQISDREAQQDMLIQTILLHRKQLTDQASSRTCMVQKVHKPKDSMSMNLIPKCPFIPALVSGERVYMRLHSEQQLEDEFRKVDSRAGTSGLLEVPYQDLYKLAVANMSKKIGNNSSHQYAVHTSDCVDGDLWVEKYKPQMYLQLLSDEATNRSLLYWLKLWDKAVFNRESSILKNRFQGNETQNFLDEHHLPKQKIALLCGPPGLGKTTLARMIAKQAGYCPVEINASDDRSALSFKAGLEAATQMKAVIGINPQPNCLILDEIDGAPQVAVDALIKHVTGKFESTNKTKKGQRLLKRPIICICNDVYVPALKSLRQISFTLVFPQISSTRLAERLMEISRMEKINTDFGTMMTLSEKSNNDIRACLSVLQYLKARSPRVTLMHVQSSNVGNKDLQHGLFYVWDTVFRKKLNKISQNSTTNLKLEPKDVLKTVQGYGDFEHLAVGIFENYTKIRTTEASISDVIKGLSWFVFNDVLLNHIQSTQNYAVYSYLPWAFVQWHILFASIQRPKLVYPSAHYDASFHSRKNQQILDFTFSGMTPKLKVFQQKEQLLLDVASTLMGLLIPNVRPVSYQLFSQKEKEELGRVVNIMADYNINYTQVRTSEGCYAYQLDPNFEELTSFKGRPRENSTSYTIRQLLSKEVESEKLRRAAIKASPQSNLSRPFSVEDTSKYVEKSSSSSTSNPLELVPNHLQKLTPKALKQKIVNIQAKDFFGRIVKHSESQSNAKAKADEIVKSDIWFHFKEGYNNAVRKNVYVSELL